MRETIKMQVLRYFSLTAIVLTGSMTVAAGSWQDGVVIKGEKGSDATDVRIGQERYGPISSNDTLWDIARRFRPHSGVTQYQTMVAIVQANEDAFVNGNMNRMLDGFYLRIPSLQEIQMVNPEAARRQVVVDGQLKAKSQELSQAEESTQNARAEQQELLEQARTKAAQAIQEVEQRQEQNFDELRSDIQQSMQTVERMYGENQSLQERIDELATRLDKLAAAVSKTDELEIQFQQVLAQQQKLLEEQARENAEQKSGILDWLQSPLNMLLVSVLPALLIVVLIVFLFLRRSQSTQNEDEQEAPRKDLTEEEAAEQLDKELLGEVPKDSTDGLFDIEGEDIPEDEGDDLSALEAELTGQSNEVEENDFSVRLDNDDIREQPNVEATESFDEDLDDDDQAVLPGEDDDESNELSQDELDRLFGETGDDDEQAIDLSVDETEEPEPAVSENDAELQDTEKAKVDSDETEESSNLTDDEDIDALLAGNAPGEDTAVDESTADETQEENKPDAESDDLLPDDFDDSEVDDVLAELGLTEAESTEQATLESTEQPEAEMMDEKDGVEPETVTVTGQTLQENSGSEEDDLEQLLQESDELTRSLEDIDDIDEEIPASDVELDQAEDEADKDLESLFGGVQETQQDEEVDSFKATDDDDFVDIDSLMAEADEEEEGDDRYQSSAVNDVLPGDESGDAEGAPADDDAAGQLDLARAYIEMGEKDEAREILQQLAEGDDDALAQEAKTLQQKLDS